MGDILVYVNNECVLGASQAQACLIFQSIGVGELVTLQVCRGYPLLFDPTNKVFPFNLSFSLYSIIFQVLTKVKFSFRKIFLSTKE